MCLPKIFEGTRFYRIFFRKNPVLSDLKHVFTVQNYPLSINIHIFTVSLANFRPVCREFFSEKPARTGGTSLSGLIGEYFPRDNCI